MKILIVLNYYYPYISGLTECARLLAEELAKDHEVTVLTAKHQKELKEIEHVNGVKVIRANILFRISKGYISPDFILKFKKLAKENEVINLHLPMIEASVLSLLCKRRKLVITYQCDVHLTNSLLNSLIMNIMDISSRVSLKRAESVIVSSIDYAMHSRVLNKFHDKWVEIPPTSPNYKWMHPKMDAKNKSIIKIGFCGRIVEEKGIDILLKAAPDIKKHIPNVEFHIVGDYQNVAGGSIYNRLLINIGWDGKYVKFLGRLSDIELRNFYSSLDLLVLPSINSMEAFGMVQVEAMLCGVPVVATNLPGVRGVVQKSGMGEVVEAKNHKALIDGIFKVLDNKGKYTKSRSVIDQLFGENTAIQQYSNLFKNIKIKQV